MIRATSLVRRRRETVRIMMPPAYDADLPEDQRAIRAKCFHPTGTFVPFPTDEAAGSLSRRFEEQVGRDPGRLAIKTRKHAFTYGELNAVANRVAHAIVRHSGNRDEPVALLFAHDALAIAAMLGALKAGRPYVPLDPSYPRQRLDYILRDSTARLLLTEHRHAAAARELGGNAVHIVELESIDAPADNFESVTGPQNLAFILYTSGSTGQPKGITQSHRNVLHDVMHYTNSGHHCADDRFLLLSSLSFADSVRTVYGSLLNGASLFPFDIHEEGCAPLAAWMLDQRITIYRSVPTLFRHFVQSFTGRERFADLRLIYLGGEAVLRTDVELYRRCFAPACVLVNRLGTTETLTFRYYFIDHDTALPGTIVPVGYAVPDQDVILFDEAGNESAPGAVGEMAIRSRYLSPGHWRRTDLTEATFAVDAEDSQLRTYRTGDLGRFRPDGCLEHLGRKDFQVKIRGHRIETAEVEAALLRLDCIREAVVIAERRRSHDSLCAYVVAATEPPPTTSMLRALLSTAIPDYMIPSSYVVLDSLPLLPNGKVNRRGLPPRLRARPALDEPVVVPRNPTEAAVAALWEDVLELEAIGIHDAFLDLGGDSLAATQVVTRVRDRFGLDISIAMLWQAPTVASMASLVSEHLRSHTGAPAIPSGGDSGTSLTRIAPRDRVEQVLVEIWESTLDRRPIGVADNFFELGGRSITAARVFSRIEAVFGKTLPIATLFYAPTIAALADRIREPQAAADKSCVIEIQRGDGGLPIFFVHGIGGNAVGFKELARLLGSDQPVYGIQARGLDDDHPPDTSIEEMAAHYVAAVKMVRPHGPYALGGFSFGGVVAFEMARLLTAGGARVALLALLDASALGSHRLLPRLTHLRRKSLLLVRRIRYHGGNLWRMRRHDKIDYVVRKARTLRRRARSRLWQVRFRLYSALGRPLAPAALRTPGVVPARFRNVTESLTLAIRRYTPRPYAGSATLFRARDKPAGLLVDPALGWSGLVARLEIREVPGDHQNLLTKPHVESLAAELKTCLDEARNADRNRSSAADATS